MIHIIELGTISKVAYTADQHIGNHQRMGGTVESGLNRRCREHVSALDTAVDVAVAHDCGLHLGLGDLFDSEKPRPQLVAAAQECCDRIMHAFLEGNHEQNTASRGDHALGSMSPVATIIEDPTVMISSHGAILAVPYQSSAVTPTSEWLPEVVAACRAELNANASWQAHTGSTPRRPVVLALHVGIKDDGTPPWLADSPGAIHVEQLAEICKEYDLDIVIAGDWHEHRRWDNYGPPIIQCGALCPTGFDNPAGDSSYGSVYTIDFITGKIEREIVPGPRFHKSQTTQIRLDAAMTNYLEVTCASANLIAEREQLAQLLTDQLIIAGEVLPDRGEIEIAAREAADGAKAADSVEGAVHAFIERMPIDPEHTHLRRKILETTLEFIS